MSKAAKSNLDKVGYTIEEVTLSFIEKCRFYVVMLSKMAKVPCKQIPTAGVGFNKFGKLSLYYNPDFIKSLPLKEAQALLEHECCHVVYRHLSRFPFKQTTTSNIGVALKDYHDNKIVNWGCDIAINQYIPDLPSIKEGDKAIGQKSYDGSIIKAGDPMGLYPETFGFPKELHAEYYVAELRKKFPDPPKMKLVCNSCNGTGMKPKPDQKQDQGQQQSKDQQQGQQGQDQQQGQQQSQDQGQQGQDQGQQGDGQQGQDQGDGQEQGDAQSQPQHGQGKDPCPDCGGQGGHDLGSLDSHDLWGKVMEVDDKGNITSVDNIENHPDIDPEHECEQVVVKAIKETKEWGKIPAHVLAEVERITAKKRHNWKRELKVFINSVLTVAKRLTQKRVDRRIAALMLDYLAPGKKKARRPKIAYVRDTSGSMFSDEVQAEIANELEILAKSCDVFVFDADTSVKKQKDGKYYYRYKKAKDLRPYLGGGGTCFVDAFKRVAALNVDGVIYATDTYGSFPDAKSIGKYARSTIWLTFSQDKADIPFGRHVNINPNDYK